MEQQEIQQKYMKYQVLDQNIKQLQQQLETADQQIIAIMATIQSLDEYKTVKDGTEILVPLNNGIFTKATLKKEDSVLINVGSSVIVEKSIEDTKKLIEKQKEEIISIKEKMSINMNKLLEKASALEKELSQIMQSQI